MHGFSRRCGGSARILGSDAQGTTVCMLLPVLVAAPEATPQATPGAILEPVALVVSDAGSPLRQLLCDSLRLLGYRAVPVADAAALLAAMQRHHAADVVLIDMSTTGSGGPQGGGLGGRLRAAWPATGVVLVGGDEPVGLAGQGLATLRLPLDLTTLSQAVRQAVGEAVGNAIGPKTTAPGDAALRPGPPQRWRRDDAQDH